MNAPDGRASNAVYGFMGMLLRALTTFHPTHLAVAFDTPSPTFRHQTYDAYKAGRAELSTDLIVQFPMLKDLLMAMGVSIYELPGWEADDLLGTLSSRADMPCLLVTGDRDALQLVQPGVRCALTRKGLTELSLLDEDGVRELIGVAPTRVTDLKGLMGDASDNIPGVRKVGEKTALKLLLQYETLEAVLAAAPEIPGKLGENLRAFAQDARMSKDLATIDRDAPVDFAVSDCAIEGLATPQALALLVAYGMNSLVTRLQQHGGVPEQRQPAPSPAPTPNPATVHEATSPEEFRRLLLGQMQPPTAFHLSDETMSFAFGTAVHPVLVLARLGGNLLEPGCALTDALEVAAPYLEGGALALHDGKALKTRLSAHGITPSCAFDTLLASYLEDATKPSPTLSEATTTHLGEDLPDARGVARLQSILADKLQAGGMAELFADMEMPLSQVLYDMEGLGFSLDRAALAEIGDDLRVQAESLRGSILDRIGHEINLNSTQQLATVLFDEMGLPAIKKTKTGRSTDSDVLEALTEHHPIASEILEYRHLVKLIGTYIDGLAASVSEDGRVHTRFHQALTATGRISSSEPNLQNIPVRTQQGRQIRRAFIAQDGWTLIDADYSQIELRVLAHMSGDPAFIDAFRSGQDIHRRTASEVYGIPIDIVTPAMRSAAKAVNFGIVYGISEFGLAQNTGVTRHEAAELIARFFARYPKVKAYMDGQVRMGYDQGYVATLLGRRRRLPELTSSNHNTRRFGERVAMNMPIQGTAADIIKLSMVRVARALHEEGLRAQLILQVHDELILEAPEAETSIASALLKREMERVVTLSVPLQVDVSSGTDWLVAHGA